MDTSSCTRDLGVPLAFGGPWPGCERDRGVRQRQPQILLFQSLWIMHRGVNGVRPLQAVFLPHSLVLPSRECALLPFCCLERPRTPSAPALGPGFGEMQVGTIPPVRADPVAPGAARTNSLSGSSRKEDSFSL